MLYDFIYIFYLQHDLQNYCQTWGLKVNMNKTKVMIFELRRYTNYNFVINGNILEVVTTYISGDKFIKRSHKKLVHHASFALHNLFVVFKPA